MIRLNNPLEKWGSCAFEKTLQSELQNLDPALLPLQQGLSQSNYVSESGFKVLILSVSDTEDSIVIRTGIQYAGIIAGSCCSDDPTPVDEQPEYCEVEFSINKSTAETTVSLLEQ